MHGKRRKPWIDASDVWRVWVYIYIYIYSTFSALISSTTILRCIASILAVVYKNTHTQFHGNSSVDAALLWLYRERAHLMHLLYYLNDLRSFRSGRCWRDAYERHSYYVSHTRSCLHAPTFYTHADRHTTEFCMCINRWERCHVDVTTLWVGNRVSKFIWCSYTLYYIYSILYGTYV